MFFWDDIGMHDKGYIYIWDCQNLEYTFLDHLGVFGSDISDP
jgi:hypothetical protein